MCITTPERGIHNGIAPPRGMKKNVSPDLYRINSDTALGPAGHTQSVYNDPAAAVSVSEIRLAPATGGQVVKSHLSK